MQVLGLGNNCLKIQAHRVGNTSSEAMQVLEVVANGSF